MLMTFMCDGAMLKTSCVRGRESCCRHSCACEGAPAALEGVGEMLLRMSVPAVPAGFALGVLGMGASAGTRELAGTRPSKKGERRLASMRNAEGTSMRRAISSIAFNLAQGLVLNFVRRHVHLSPADDMLVARVTHIIPYPTCILEPILSRGG
jgi:hypothetical protein